MVRHYLAHGLRVASEMPLPLPEEPPVEDPDVRLRRVEPRVADDGSCLGLRLVATTSPGSRQQVDVWRTEARLRLDYPGSCAFEIHHDGSLIEAHPHQGAKPAEIADHFLSVPLACAALRSGRTPLHASAVIHGPHALGFAAPSGFGKSTIAAACLAQGASLAADDAVLLTRQEGSAFAQLGHRRLMCHPRVVAVLGIRDWPNQVVSAVRSDPSGRLALWLQREPGATTVSVRPLDALFILAPRLPSSSRSVRIHRVRPSRILALLGHQIHAASLFEPQERNRQLATLAGLAERTPIFELAFPDDLARIREHAGQVLRHIGELLGRG
jgi:hypothetical protein